MSKRWVKIILIACITQYTYLHKNCLQIFANMFRIYFAIMEIDQKNNLQFLKDQKIEHF